MLQVGSEDSSKECVMIALCGLTDWLPWAKAVGPRQGQNVDRESATLFLQHVSRREWNLLLVR